MPLNEQETATLAAIDEAFNRLCVEESLRWMQGALGLDEVVVLSDDPDELRRAEDLQIAEEDATWARYMWVYNQPWRQAGVACRARLRVMLARCIANPAPPRKRRRGRGMPRR